MQKSIANLSAFLIAAITPIVFFPCLGRSDSFTCKFFFMGLVTIFFLFALVREAVPTERLELEGIPVKCLALYALLVAVSLVLSEDPVMGFLGYTGRLDGYLTLLFYIAIFFIGRACDDPSDLFYKGIALAAMIVSLFVLCEIAGYRPYTSFVFRKIRFTAATGTMGNRNFLGTYLATTMPVHFYLAFYRKKYFYYATLLLSASALAAAQARGPWLALAFGILFYLVRFLRKHDRRFLILIPILGALFFGAIAMMNHRLSIPFLSRFLSIFRDAKAFFLHGFDATKAGSHRVFVWGKSWELVKKSPLIGYGPENMQLAMRKFFYDDVVAEIGRYLNYDKAHNEYLNIAVTSGLPSLAVYLAFVTSSLKDAAKKLARPEIETLFIAVVIYLVQAFFNISVPNTAYIFWLFLGLLSREGMPRVWDTEPCADEEDERT